MMNKLKFFTKQYFKEYEDCIGKDFAKVIQNLEFSGKKEHFEYLIKASAVYSANIEGNSIDLNSFMNYEHQKQKFKKTKEIEEIENLIEAYQFAKTNDLLEKNLLKTHQILAKTLLNKNLCGKYRKDKVGVFGEYGLIYLAVEPEFVKNEMQKFFSDVKYLIKTNLTIIEIFYFASFLHLRFAHIHPFMDGNGRIARILEKWFIAQKLGEKFWEINSEKFYKNNQKEYYKNINLGVNFYELNYDKCVDFLKMLPQSII